MQLFITQFTKLRCFAQVIFNLYSLTSHIIINRTVSNGRVGNCHVLRSRCTKEKCTLPTHTLSIVFEWICGIPVSLVVVADRNPLQLRHCDGAVDSRCVIAAGPARCADPPSRYRHVTLPIGTAEHRPPATESRPLIQWVQVKVKFTLEQATKAQRGSRGTTLFFL
jgi:hypothetical protein